ncbi:hypothetical protein NKW51_09280 [Acetobacter lambici]|uniref:Uncharacterized protein n=1 Tax=Acetobacter lambici TaxID=1332824 RepID=A0ABT1F1D3_9PROT|nr:hypothetical protein [Acetobacter lambici]MCP1242793.1 hypothetical protein [Acetobacter lambici]MCP1258963.1 hypothetical protein [Acetobacter lambici]
MLINPDGMMKNVDIDIQFRIAGCCEFVDELSGRGMCLMDADNWSMVYGG